MQEPKSRDRSSSDGDRLAGYASLGCMAVGIAGLLAAVVSWGGNDMQGGGLCLIAAAIAFGSLLVSLGR